MSEGKKDKKETLLLLDTHAILHRAFHAIPDFSTSAGEPTGALYGLASLLIKIIKEIKPNYIAACYDLPGPTFRDDVFGEYKAGRAKTDDALIAQITRSRDIFKAFHIPMYDAAGFEADDCIGTIVEQTKDNNSISVLIATGDMDTLQLVRGEDVRVYTLKKGINDTIIYDEKAVRERFGFEPDLLRDYKGLRGDPTDNIPGIKGVGEVTALKLIQNIGGIEKIYSALKKGDEKFIEIGVKGKTLELIKNGEEEAIFSKMLGTIRRDASIHFSLDEAAWKQNGSFDEIRKIFTELEFRSLLARLQEMYEDKKKVEIPRPDNGESLPLSKEDETIKTEAAIALWLIDSSKTDASVEEVLEATNATSINEAHALLLQKLRDENLFDLFNTIEKPLIPILRTCEDRGILVDRKYVRTLRDEYSTRLKALEEKIWKHAEATFNINSPKQLSEILFVKLGLGEKRMKKTPTGAISTKAGELEKLQDKHPIVPLLLEYREIQKLLSTYLEPIAAKLDDNNRLHTHFLQNGTETGRFSSQNPNLQNIPTRTDMGQAIRNAFIASPGHKLVSLDYSQIELRVLAALSKDEKLVKIFTDGGDVHTAVASNVFGVPAEKVDKEMRRRAKVINFGIIYGMGVNALKTNLGTSREEAQAFLDKYFETFSGVTAYLKHSEDVARKIGYTETYFGRRRQFAALKSPIPYVRAAAERAASNAPLQGTAADVIKKAMVESEKKIIGLGLHSKTHLLLQIHDELVYEIEESVLNEAITSIRQTMESVFPGDVPLLVHVKCGDRFGELESFSA